MMNKTLTEIVEEHWQGTGNMKPVYLIFAAEIQSIKDRLDALPAPEPVKEEKKDYPLPCPFCGSPAKIYRCHTGHIGVCCSKPSGCVTTLGPHGDTAAEAIAQWNRRDNSELSRVLQECEEVARTWEKFGHPDAVCVHNQIADEIARRREELLGDDVKQEVKR